MQSGSVAGKRPTDPIFTSDSQAHRQGGARWALWRDLYAALRPVSQARPARNQAADT
jgi:hypothetical protein